MSDVQRVIKYIAIAFAIYLIVNIIGVIIMGVSSLFFVFDGNDAITSEMKTIEVDTKKTIEVLDIDLGGTNLEILEDDTFRVETNNSYIETKQSSNKLIIEERHHNWFRNYAEGKVIIYMPKNLKLQKFIVEAGAGKIAIDSVLTENLDLDLGAGQVTINNLEVTKKTEIDGGAGEFIIKNGSLTNLDFDMGVGHASLTAEILGKSEIDAGVGELEINLIGTKEDYQMNIDKGIGNIRIDGDNYKSNSTYGEGPNRIDIKGGVGSIRIDFSNKENQNDKQEPPSNETKPTDSNTKTEFTRTYKILSVVPNAKENSYYLTLQIFQGEVDTVLVKDFKENLTEGKNYEFTFEKNNVKLKDPTLKEIFKSYKLVKVEETAKVGMAQTQDNIE